MANTIFIGWKGSLTTEKANMKLTFRVPTLNQVFNSTLWTQEDGISPYWRDCVYTAYQIDKNKALALSEQERMEYVKGILTQVCKNKLGDFKKLVTKCQTLWNSNAKEINAAFSKAYDVDVDPILNDMKAYVNLNPICPRYLDNHTFYVFCDMKIDRIMRTCFHEIMHFVWFYKWQEHFHDDPKEYDNPHLKWIFSEMVQNTMVENTPIKNLSEWRGNVYDYFYTMKINGKPILKTLDEIHVQKGLIGLFEEGYAYCLQHEKEIRAAIEEAEKFISDK